MPCGWPCPFLRCGSLTCESTGSHNRVKHYPPPHVGAERGGFASGRTADRDGYRRRHLAEPRRVSPRRKARNVSWRTA